MCVSHCLWVLKFSCISLKKCLGLLASLWFYHLLPRYYYNIIIIYNIIMYIIIIYVCVLYYIIIMLYSDLEKFPDIFTWFLNVFFLSQQWCTCFEWQWYLLHWWVWQDEWQHQSSSSWGHGKYFHNGKQLYFNMWNNRKYSQPH